VSVVCVCSVCLYCVSVVCVCSRCNIHISGKIIKEMSVSEVSGTHCIYSFTFQVQKFYVLPDSAHRINPWVFITETECFYCAVFIGSS